VTVKNYVDPPLLPGSGGTMRTDGENAVTHFVVEQLKLSGCRSFLDAGCGDGKYITRVRSWMTPPVEAWALEAWEPSLEQVTADRKILGELPWRLLTLPSRCIDAAICLDVIEHLEKCDGWDLLKQLERVARKLVIVFTPSGFMPQEGDRPWQKHLSGWTAEDLEGVGYSTFLWKDFNYGKAERSDALWGVKGLQR
jgi:SAM-dependent methyltransferase